MKASVSLAAVFLALGPAIVSAQAVNGVLPFLPTAVPRALADHDGLVERTDSQGCNADNVLRALRNAKQSQEASAFCSTFIQPTTTTTSTNTIPKTDVIVVQTTETILTTATVTTAIATNTVLCPPPASTTTKCNIRAYGFSQFLISQEPGVSSAACEQKCLADPNCKSYQTQLDGASFCNLFRVKTEGNVQIIDQDNFYFFDRECPDNRPAACADTPAKMRRRVDRRDVPIPTFLATVPATRISSACSCFITSAKATATVTVVVPVTQVTTVTTTIPTTITAVQLTTVSVTAIVASTVPP